jgi:capsular polysaccharide biosynthesis protein
MQIIPTRCEYIGSRQVLFARDFAVYDGEIRHISNGIVTPNFLIVEKDGILNPGYSHFPLDLFAAVSVYPELKMGWDAPRNVERGAVICGGPHGADSYWHWLMDYFPRLALVDEDWPLIVNSDLSPIQKEMLALTGRSNLVLKEPTEALRVADLLAPSFLSRTGCVYPEAVKFIRHFRGNGGPEKIYVSRRGVSNRALTNEAEIEQALSAIGFEIVVPHELTFAEQSAIFSGARVICGPHGGGLANAIFAPAGCRVIEIMTKPHTAHAYLAAVCKQFHRHVLCGVEDNRLFAPVEDVVRACTL